MAETLRHRIGRRIRGWRRMAGWERRRLAYRAPEQLRPHRSARQPIAVRPSTAHPNPIIHAELLHLARRSDQRRRPAAILVYVAFVLSILLTVMLGLIPKSGNLMTATMRSTYVLLSNALEVVNLALLALTFTAQIVLTGQALSFASETVAREKDGGTWELILLTGRDPGKTVVDKWWGILIYLFRRYHWLIFVRAGVFLWLGLSATRDGIFFERPDMLSPLAAAVFMLGFTFLDIALAAAAGLVASVRFRRNVSGAVTLALFFTGVFLFAAVLTCFQNALGLFRYGLFPNTAIPLIVTPVDSGIFLAISLMHPLNAQAWLEVAVGVVGSLITYAVLIGGLVGLARLLAARAYLRQR